MAAIKGSTSWLSEYIEARLCPAHTDRMQQLLTAMGNSKESHPHSFARFSKSFTASIGDIAAPYVMDTFLACLAFRLPDIDSTNDIKRANQLDQVITEKLIEIANLMDDRDDICSKYGLCSPIDFTETLQDTLQNTCSDYLYREIRHVFGRFVNDEYWPTPADFIRAMADLNMRGTEIDAVTLRSLEGNEKKGQLRTTKAKILRALWQENAEIVNGTRPIKMPSGESIQLRNRLSDYAIGFLAWIYRFDVTAPSQESMSEQTVTKERKRIRDALRQSKLEHALTDEDESLLRLLEMTN